jgi:hypothetical protein
MPCIISRIIHIHIYKLYLCKIHVHINTHIYIHIYIDLYNLVIIACLPRDRHFRFGERSLVIVKLHSFTPNDDDVYLEYYSGKGFHINYSCLQVLRKTHKLVQ